MHQEDYKNYAPAEQTSDRDFILGLGKRVENLEFLTQTLNATTLPKNMIEFSVEQNMINIWNKVDEIEKWKKAAIEKNIQDVQRIRDIEKALENYREYKTGIEDLETDSMYLKKRIEEIEKIINNSSKWCKDLIAHHYFENNKRLEQLESDHISEKLDPKVWMFLHEKLDLLETELNIVRALVSRVDHPKKPHKCPVCDGTKKRKLEFGEPSMPYQVNPNCYACEGKGIVWG